MADIISPQKRSENMALIKAKDTKPEVYIRKILFAHGYRFRKNIDYLPGHPDIWMRKHNLAIFVHGCFWHRHVNCKLAYTPKSRKEFWSKKFHDNQLRDERVLTELSDRHIRVLIIWECTIRRMKKDHDEEKSRIQDIESFIHSDKPYEEL